MNNTVYLLGAGVNQDIKDWDGFSPPLINDFFQVALKKSKYTNDRYSDLLKIVFDYIYKYWKKTKTDLTSTPFDLEECFTMLDFHLKEAIAKNDFDEIKKLHTIQFRLKSLVAELLSEFGTFASSSIDSNVMQLFGEHIFKEKPIILSFNYDCYIESIIESASQLNTNHPPKEMFGPNNLEVTDNEISYSHYNWNRPLGYSLEFDEVQFHRPGIPKYVKGKRFYSHPDNQLYSWYILKLHGSLNWFRYLPIKRFQNPPNDSIGLPQNLENNIILANKDYEWWFGEPPTLNEWYLDPIIITPVLHKKDFLSDPIYNRIFTPIWEKAKEALSNCKKLIVIGYSFSSADFLTKKLFLESFSEHTIEELIIVNPDISLIQKIKDLCHFEKPVTLCKQLKEFLNKVN